MLPLIVIRPEPGNAATVAAANGLGLTVLGVPLFVVEPRAWEAPPAEAFDVLLAGSANVFRLGGPGLAAYRTLPVHAVGATTARAAAAKGFVVATVGSGGLQTVLARVPAGTRVLRLAGEERVRLTAPAGVTVEERVVYASRPLPMPPELAAVLRHPAAVMLHSAEAAGHLAAECDRVGLDRGGIALVTIGPRVSAAAGAGWRTVAEAATPAEAPLLARARDLCHTPGGTEHGCTDGR